jgi:hypothetical protein
VIVALAALIPRQPAHALGGELLVIGGAAWLAISAILYSGRGKRPWKEYGPRVLMSQTATLPTLVAAILLLAANGQSLYWQATSGVLCLLAGIAYAWVLLIEILR